ncbi:MAG: glutamate synthase large subunit [Puniceicoccaceae bacterium]
MSSINFPPLYRPSDEHDACGVGFIANMHGIRSYQILDRAISGLKNLAHRGAIDADAITGDGAGILTQIPYGLFREFLEKNGKHLYRDDDLGVGMIFLPRNDPYAQSHAKHLIEKAVRREDLNFLAWREVPINPDCLGKKAELSRPLILQALVARDEALPDDAFERKLFLAMRNSMRQALADKIPDFYICSFSSKTITYKGLLNAPQVRHFFLDLKSPLFQTAFAIFHQRFATNTLPDWQKAQPYRMLAHNGEINTIRGNRNLMRAREFSTAHGVWGDRYADLSPIIQPNMSDSTSLDNALQVMTVAGRSCLHGVSILMPEAWERNPQIDPKVKAFYKCHSALMEPWDGPAAVAFTDGRFVAGALDRNGLRPARYKIYEDGTVVLGSEAGLIKSWGSKVVRAGRLGPGTMLAVDIKDHRVFENQEIKSYLANEMDYEEWCRRTFVELSDLAADTLPADTPVPQPDSVVAHRILHGYSLDEEELVLLPMLNTGAEGIGSMGDDTPIAALSKRSRLLYTYFKQQFAQVTNPAIDSLREASVMSLNMHLGGRLGLFEPLSSEHHFVTLESPVLLSNEFAAISNASILSGQISTLEATFDPNGGPAALEEALNLLLSEARRMVSDQGARLIVLSDRQASRTRAPIPMLLAVGAVHQELVRAGRRLECDLIADTGEARDVHQFACLLGFGANAIHPWFALDLVNRLVIEGKAEPEVTVDKAQANFRKALDKGILKIMSKMGISTLFSYQAGQVFEILGISQEVVDKCFYGTTSSISGIGFEEIASETLARHQRAYPVSADLPVELWDEGYYSVVKRGEAEFHAWNSKVIGGMNKIIRAGGDFEKFAPFKEAAEEHAPYTIKDLLRFKYPVSGVDLSEVEPIEDIRRRFTTAAMSLGAISPEAHECLAVALNAIGGKSNSGEGGEDPVRFKKRPDGSSANSAIKQVASGRFGVTAEYLANAREIEIKVAQGAKPGEGGQLPGHKVTELIARLRYSVPGVTLISPPPHHDIYSIEDLAQLIFDLKQVNPRAKVCVKLVSSSGVGTIAAGVAKAYADVILISGHEGGTGASPLSSIKSAGSPWEIGLAEAHQVLMMNDLRGRVVLRTDGGFKTGRDIVIASILGAEEYNFGTAALIAAGCAMFRVCHKNTCPVGVATQREDLREKFRGKPENIIQYFNAVAEDTRRIMAKLGVRTIDELVGRTDLLEQVDDLDHPKAMTIDLSPLLHQPDADQHDKIHVRERNDRIGNEGSVDDLILQDAIETVTHKTPRFAGSYKVENTMRNIGTRLSGEIAYMHGNAGLETGKIQLKFTGSAGQSFGTFLVQGLRLTLFGEAQDYVGKGMNGGEIIVRPREDETFEWSRNTIIGNTCLYGATGGVLFAAGQAGERFAVRNSGAIAVVEGVGDHGCEYMTGGTIVCLGKTGRNFGAGMSGGLAFIYDPDSSFESQLNTEMVGIARLDRNEEIEALHDLIKSHKQTTGSPLASRIIDDWSNAIHSFWRVTPNRTDEVPESVFTNGKAIQELFAAV